MAVFQRSDILVPAVLEMDKWSVIACDQFTSDPQYWDRVQMLVGEKKSSLKLIFPEAWLNSTNMLFCCVMTRENRL